MSYLLRLSRRAVAARSLISVAMPKGAVRRAPAYRSEATIDEEEPIAPLRRALAARRTETSIRERYGLSREALPAAPDASAATPFISGQSEKESGEEIDPIQRQADDEEEELAMLRRMEKPEEEEDLAPLRRQEDEEEELATLRQQDMPVDQEDDAMLMRSSLRPTQAADAVFRVEASHGEPAEDLSEDAMQLRRNVEDTPATAVAVVPPVLNHRTASHDTAAMLTDNLFSGSSFAEPLDFSPAAAGLSTREPPQSDVIIEQLDVLIHEPSAPSVGRSPSPGLRNRPMRARYLRRL